MELIPINESKLKIMLDESDMKELNIYDEADCACGETRLAIRTILERAKAQIGFNTEGSEIFVQLYTSKGGGCELFVTKSGSLASSVQSRGPKNDKKVKKHEPQTKKINDEDCRALSVHSEKLPDHRRAPFGKMIFSFESMRDICTVCRILRGRSEGISSHAYRGDADDFYLVLENTNMSGYSRLDALTFILEYGNRERTDHMNTYLSEHGHMVCRNNAIEILSQF